MLVEQRRYDEAERLLEDRGGSFEHNAGIRQTLGHIASFKGEPDKAVRFYAEACVLAPEDMGALEDLARAQMDAGQLDDAEHNLSRVIQSMKGEPRRDLRHLEAKCLEGMGRHGEARSIYLGLTGGKDGSSDVVAWIGAGRTACALSDFARVRIAANRIIALAPARAEGRLLLAACKRQDGDLEGALALADEAAALAPNDPASWVFKGVVFRQMGRLDEAAQSLATAVRIDPTNARVREMLAAIEAKD
jgi:tetratricopeptide (TPR) repeat protein